MPPRSADAACPCGSGRKFKRCCLRLHRGATAATPEALMRSRYAAYAVGDVDYIIATTDPNGPQFQADRSTWARSIAAFSAGTRFEKLEIRAVGPIVDERGEVEFFARLSRDGDDVSFVERSVFVRRDGRWMYVGPVDQPTPAADQVN
jgi:SEC-C motif-containing protein